jgi:hypothetical protein
VLVVVAVVAGVADVAGVAGVICAAFPVDISIVRAIATADKPIFMTYFFILVGHRGHQITANAFDLSFIVNG